MNSIPDLAKPAPTLGEQVQAPMWSTNVRSVGSWVLALLPILILTIVFYDAIGYMANLWVTDDNYGHGLLVPMVSLYLIWTKRRLLAENSSSGSWWGIVWILSGMVLYGVGELATVYVLLHLSLWCIIVGLLLSSLGTRAVRTIVFPLAYLLTAVPLPQFLYQTLSGKLQLISSALGVGCLQLLGITAFRDGNVIDLGPIQLQVVDACSGLRYLFPLATLALLCSYLFRDRMWKRVVLFLSSIPISILLNGFRIGMIGFLVEHFGQGAADGFYHLFEGWVLFIASLGLLLTEMWVLRHVNRSSSVTADEAPSPKCHSARLQMGSMPLRPSYLYSVGLLTILPLASTQLSERGEIVPLRQPFLDFPLQVKEWSGISYPLAPRYVEVLRFDDYLLADYRQPQTTPVNFYVAYYRSQRKGQSAHSPQTCIPGGGWEIMSIRSIQLDPFDAVHGDRPANRVLIQKGDQRQIVLYWFKQRNRVLANEYLVKLYVLWDAIARQRTDGALVRLTTPIQPDETDENAAQRLLQFAHDTNPMLAAYIPD